MVLTNTTHIGFHRYASEYFEGAKILVNSANNKHKTRLPSQIYDAPVYFLFAHALELFLKSYLLKQGCTLDYVRKLNHNLERTYKACLSKGMIELASEQLNDLKKINFYHKGYEFRYIKTGYKSYPTIENIINLAKTLQSNTDPKWNLKKSA